MAEEIEGRRLAQEGNSPPLVCSLVCWFWFLRHSLTARYLVVTLITQLTLSSHSDHVKKKVALS
jgi:hypothetical protein